MMKAVRRWGLGFAMVAALAAAPLPVRAQDAAPPAEDTTTVGPRELQNFSINGTVTQPAPERSTPAPSASRPAPAQQPPATQAQRPTTPATTTQASRPPAASTAVAETRPSAAEPSPRERTAAAEPLRQTSPSSSVTVALPQVDSTAEAEPAPVPDLPASGGMTLWPWLLAAFAVAIGAGLYLFRDRLRPALAGGADDYAFAAPEPEAAPAPAPVTPRASAPRHDPIPPRNTIQARVPPLATPTPPPTPAPNAPPAAPDPFAGLVSTRLRPWIELAFQPSRCAVEDDKVTIDFEIEMVNRGNAPARGVLVEARIVNAGPEQDSEIGQFFANPVGQGERIESIPPLKNVRIQSRIVTPRENVVVYEVGGRQVFVPLIAFNILYGWSRGEGQTSVGYLIGRDTKGDKLAPFRLDMGPRLFRTLGKTPLPLEVRQ